MPRIEIEEIIGVNKTRFFALVKAYYLSPETFSIAYLRTGSPKLSEQVEAEVKQELLREKDLIKDPRLPIYEYNYSALRERLRKKDIRVPYRLSLSEQKGTIVTSPDTRQRPTTGKW